MLLSIYSNGGCLPNAWGDYPWAFGICLMCVISCRFLRRGKPFLTAFVTASSSLFLIFVMEMFAYRLGTAHLAKLGINIDGDAHHRAKLGQQHEHEIKPTPSSEATTLEKTGLKFETSSESDQDYSDSSENTPVMAQIIGIAVLEFGVVLVRQ